MGQHGDVAAVHVVGVGAHTLRHEALQVGVDGAVVVGHDVPARLRLPRGALGVPAEQTRVRYHLGRPDQLLLLFGEVARERLDALRQQPDAPVRDLDVVEDVRDGELVLQALGGLRLVRGERGDVDQPGDAVIGSRGGYDAFAVGTGGPACWAADLPPRAIPRGAATFAGS